MTASRATAGARARPGPLRCIVFALAAATSLTACTSRSARSTDGPIQADGPYIGARVTAQNVQHATTWSSGGVAACVTKVPDQLQVTDVGLIGLEGKVTVTGGLLFGTDPIQSVAPKPLPPEYVAPKDFTASMLQQTDCAKPVGSRLWVGVNVTSGGHWKATGLYLDYRADGRQYRIELPFAMDVCAPGDDPAPECQDRPQVATS